MLGSSCDCYAGPNTFLSPNSECRIKTCRFNSKSCNDSTFYPPPLNVNQLFVITSSLQGEAIDAHPYIWEEKAGGGNPLPWKVEKSLYQGKRLRAKETNEDYSPFLFTSKLRTSYFACLTGSISVCDFVTFLVESLKLCQVCSVQ